jgi:hypothetical protein
MAPTVPPLGCRRDRFDNEGNEEDNNQLFMGQYVCSDDVDQTYWFGLDPATGDLIWYNASSQTTRTLYRNDWHRNFLWQQQQEQLMGANTTTTSREKHLPVDNEEHSVTSSSSNVSDCVQWVYNATTNATIPISFNLEAQSNCTSEEAEVNEPLFLDYYLALSTNGTLRIHRILRTMEYKIVDRIIHWELAPSYSISTVHEDCLFTHDCPYMHLHHDGVMVLAWLDFELSQWDDGWMEKNIKRCYDFDTQDCLVPCP